MYKSLGEIATIIRGERVTKPQLISNGKYPVISGGANPLGYLDKYNREEQTITIAQYGTAGYVEWQARQFWANDVCYSIYPFNDIDNRYLYHCLKCKQTQIYGLATNAIPAHLPKSRLEQLSIPIPPLEEQERIVRILDQFDTLTNSLSEGLPKEIELRRKQYTYYREQLLSFPKH